MRKLYVAFLCAVLCLGPIGLFSRDISVHVVVTSDVHARLFPYDFVNDRPVQSSMASLMYMLESVRLRQSNSMILLDNGDLLQGTPAAYYANFVQESKFNLFSRVMNLMKYDAANIGNHDIEAGPKVYNRLKAEYKFPLLGANVLHAETGEPYFVPYVIIRRQGVRIAILGLTTPSVPKWLPAHLWEGLSFQDMAEAAAYWVDYIKKNEQPDALIGLFHSGYGPLNPPQSAHPLENASAYIARHIPGFDVVFTGHDHRQRIERITNINGKDVLVLGPGHFAENIAVAELLFERVDRRAVNFISASGEMVSTKNVAPSQSFFRAFEKDVTEILAYSGQPVADLKQDIHSIEALFGSAPITDLIHHVQLELTGADISFTAPLAFDETIKAGTMLVRDFFRLYEYENYLYTMELSGWEILYFLESSYGLWYNEMKDANDHLLNFRFDQDGQIPVGTASRMMLRSPFYNFDSAAGIRYVVDVSKPAGSRVHIIEMENGEAFDIDKTYRVAINSYRGSGGGDHLTRGAGIAADALKERILASTETDLRSAMIDYFQKKGEIQFESRNNWHVVPEKWAEAGRQKDIQLLRRDSGQ
jgi:2',3'-cyclic-nucleotide 2'-phosphodiesterase / 3'-nucleotidase